MNTKLTKYISKRNMISKMSLCYSVPKKEEFQNQKSQGYLFFQLVFSEHLSYWTLCYMLEIQY